MVGQSPPNKCVSCSDVLSPQGLAHCGECSRQMCAPCCQALWGLCPPCRERPDEFPEPAGFDEEELDEQSGGSSSSSSPALYDEDDATYFIVEEEQPVELVAGVPEGTPSVFLALKIGRDGNVYKVKAHGLELSSDELRNYAKEVDAAKQKEIMSWIAHEAIKVVEAKKVLQRPMSSRWVVQWKQLPSGEYTIKARLVVRGFEDPQGYGTETYSLRMLH